MAYLPRWKWAWQRVKEVAGEAVAVGVLSLIIALGAGIEGKPAAIGVGLGGALLWTLIRFSWYAFRARIVQERAQLVELEKAPPLVVDYQFVSAPTSVAAATTIPSIKLDYAEPDPEMEVISLQGAAPIDYQRSKPSWCLCTVRNHSRKRLLSAQLVFDSEFYEGEYATADHVHFKQSIRVSLPFIDIENKFEFYIVNASGRIVSMTTPKTATVQFEGETHSRTAGVHASSPSIPSASTLTFYT